MLDVIIDLITQIVEALEMVAEVGWQHASDMECERLEERNRVLAFHFLEHDGELVVGDLVYEVALELDNDVVTGEHRAERIALTPEEAESVAF